MTGQNVNATDENQQTNERPAWQLELEAQYEERKLRQKQAEESQPAGPQPFYEPYQDTQLSAQDNARQTQAQADDQQAAAVAPSQTNGRKRPAILDQHPDLSDEHKDLIDRHRRSGFRLPEHQVRPLQDYYAFMAKLDPSSATYDPPAHTYIPMPRGGLPAIAQRHLGRRPSPTKDPEELTPAERKNLSESQAAYDADFSLYHQLLYRMNTDTLRDDTHYILHAPVRVPTEGL